ncbi:MAG: sugar phosphate isomerase/epimerase family protein [Haloplanus sp.]
MELGLTVGDSLDRMESTATGFDFAEFGLAEATDVPESIDDARLRSLLDELDLALDVHLPFEQVVATPVPEINEAIVAYQRRLLDWAATLGARKAVLHGTVRDPYDTDQRPIFATQLSRIVDAGADRGVEVVVENVGHQKHGLQLSVLGDIAEEAGAPLCFDVGHAYMEEGNDGIERFLKAHGDAVSHLHVHDVRRRGDTHMPLGAGEVDYGIVAECLDDFDGSVAVEVFTDDAELLRTTAARAAAHLGVEW